MNYEFQDCIDAGTEYCPCHLAESGDCIICSQLSGKEFCDCINWKGVCIYQEFMWNGNKAREERKSIPCKIINKDIIDDKVAVFTISVTHKLAQSLQRPGSYVFLRNPNSNIYYDAPISIMDVNIEDNTIKLAVEIKGIKTKTLNELKEGEDILVRGPFWNGVLGLKNLLKLRDSTALVVMRGIGQAPSVPVLKKLKANNNKIIAIIDKKPYTDIIIRNYLNEYSADIIESETLSSGELSNELKTTINNLLQNNKISLIHCDGPDILIFKLLEFVNDSAEFSCCNNSKMCCGEGVCGTCSLRYKNHVVKRLCKYQFDPKHLFASRRFV